MNDNYTMYVRKEMLIKDNDLVNLIFIDQLQIKLS